MAERQPSRVLPAAARKRATKAAKPDVATALPAASKGVGGRRQGGAYDDPASRIKALESERERLQFELDTARERIALLERTNREVLDRIAGVISSLHSLGKD